MRNPYACIAAIFILMLIGCSGSGDIPSTPDAAVDDIPSRLDAMHQAWGLWQFEIDPVASSVDVMPIRSAELHLNALHFLEPPVNLYLTLESPPDFSGGVLTLDIGLRHPFLGLNQFTGFDAKGIIIGHGAEVIDELPSLIYAGENDIRLLNADGHIRWWNPSEFLPDPDHPVKGYKDGLLGAPDSLADFTATLNGYKYYCDDLVNPDDTLDVIDPEGRGVFSAGQKNVRTFVIDYATSGLIFNYAVDASWQFPLGGQPWQVPDDFPEDANQPEPYRIVVNEIGNTLAYDISTGVAAGELNLEINVYDWFHADENIIGAYSADSELTSATTSTPIGGGVGYSTYALDVTPDGLDSTDDVLLWIAAECSTPDGYGGILPGETQGMYFKYFVGIEAGVSDECGELVHTYENEFAITGVTLGGNVFLGDIGLQEVGPYAGKAVIQTETNKFSAVDITGMIGNAVEYFTYSENNFHHSVDCCPYSGRIALADPGSVNNEIDIFDVNGEKLTTFIVSGENVVCLDFDDNGDIWVIVETGTTPMLLHLKYEADDPYYSPVDSDSLDLTLQFPPASGLWLFGDIAIDYEDEKAFVLGCISGGAGAHYLAAYDISGTAMFLDGRNDVFSGLVAATCHTSVKYGRRLDIEIDHSLVEYCRIVASAQINESGQFRHELVRLEDDLTTMDVYSGGLVSAYQDLPSQIIISPDDPHDLIATPQNLGKVQQFTCADW